MPDSRKEPSAGSALSDSTRSHTIPPVNNAIHPLVPVKYNYADSFLCTYIVSILAALNAELYTYPLDLTKTRLQIQGEAAAAKLNNATTRNAKHRGMFATATGIVKEEGFLKLWRGMLPAVYRHCVYSGVRISCYDYLRQTFPTTSADGKPIQAPLWKSAVFGVTAGCIAQFLASPADLIKVQLQMEGKRQLMGEKPRVLGSYHAFQEIVRRGGVRGLWKGSIPNVQRAAFVNLGDLTAYDVSKRFLMEKLCMPDCPTVHVLASLCAGVVGALLGTPADVIKTRVMNQPTDEKGRGLHYKGSLDCLRQTVAEEGLSSLYKGFTPCWMRLGPWALIFWVSFEQIKSFLGGAGY